MAKIKDPRKWHFVGPYEYENRNGKIVEVPKHGKRMPCKH